MSRPLNGIQIDRIDVPVGFANIPINELNTRLVKTLKLLGQLDRSLIETGYTPEVRLDEDRAKERLEELLDTQIGLFVATAPDSPLAVKGVLQTSTVRNQFYVDYLVINALYRRQGVGASLISHAATQAREKGLPQLKLASVESAVPFYQKLGFCITEPISSRPSEYTPMNLNL